MIFHLLNEFVYQSRVELTCLSHVLLQDKKDHKRKATVLYQVCGVYAIWNKYAVIIHIFIVFVCI